MSSWMFLLTDYQGSIIGEVMNASARQVIKPLKAMSTCTFTMQTSNRWSGYFTSPSNPEVLVKAYRDGLLQFVGPVVSSQEVGDEQGKHTIQVNASDAFWRMNARLAGIPATSPGTVTPYSNGTTITPVDLGAVARDLVTVANAQGYTGIELGTNATTLAGAVGPYYFQPIGDAISALSSANTSFDWQITPHEPTNVGQAWPQIGTFDIAATIGSVMTNVVMEYGAGAANIQRFANTIDRTGLLTRAYMEQPAVTDYSDVLIWEDSTAEAVRGVFAGLVDHGGVQFDSFRTAILQESVIVRRQARQVIDFTPRPSAQFQPVYHYNVGDQIRARAVVEGSVRFDAMFRIWGITYDINDNGVETPTLQLIPPTPTS